MCGQMVFPELDSEFRVLTASRDNAGRGLTVQNMHLSEVSRWPGDAAATLAGMRAALIPERRAGAESRRPTAPTAASTRSGCRREENGVAKHFFPWWLEPEYVVG